MVGMDEGRRPTVPRWRLCRRMPRVQRRMGHMVILPNESILSMHPSYRCSTMEASRPTVTTAGMAMKGWGPWNFPCSIRSCH